MEDEIADLSVRSCPLAEILRLFFLPSQLSGATNFEGRIVGVFPRVSGLNLQLTYSKADARGIDGNVNGFFLPS